MASSPFSTRPLKLMGGFVACSVIGGVLAAGVALPAVGTMGSAAESGARLFDQLPAEFEMTPPSETTTLLYADGSKMATYFHQNRVSVPLSEIAPVMQQALLAVEDARFYDHPGVDAKGIFRALVSNVLGGKEGASTLTQQWVKNVLLNQAADKGDKEQIKALQTANELRKIKEIKYALAAEKKLTKDQILESYLNIANFSGGAYGVEAASRRWFSKSAKDLTLVEAAQLAGTVQRPTAFNPEVRPELVFNRRNVVLKRMLEVGTITQAQYDEARVVPVEDVLKPTKAPNGCEQAGNAGFFCEYVTQLILNDDAFGKTPQERAQLLRRGGLTITTTLDPKAQDAASKILMKDVDPATSSEDIGAAIVMVKPGTGDIVTMAQNRKFVSGKSNNPTETNVNFNVGKKYGGGQGFQPGSNFKPIVLAEWLRQGKSQHKIVNAQTRDFYDGQFRRCGETYVGSGEAWPPKGTDGPSYISVQDATRTSKNPAYAEMLTQLDLCDVRKLAKSLGIQRAMPRGKNQMHGADGDPYAIDAVPSMVLGASSVTPLSVAGAYAAFAADGKFCKPIAMTQVVTSSGEKLPIPGADCKQVLDENVARNVQSVMTHVWDEGSTAGRVNPKPTHQAGGKTGTTDMNADTWFSGFTKQIAGSAWVGHVSKQETLDQKTFSGKMENKVFGSTVSAPMWTQFVNEYSKDLEKKWFTEGTPIGDAGGGRDDSGDEGSESGEGAGTVPGVWGKSISNATQILKAAGYNVKIGGKIWSSAKPGFSAGTHPAKNSSLAKGSTVTIMVSNGQGNKDKKKDADKKKDKSKEKDKSKDKKKDKKPNNPDDD